MAYTAVTENSRTWTPSGSSVSRSVYSRLYYQVTDTGSAYKIDVYGEGMIYNDNLSESIKGTLELTGATSVTGSHTYTYTSGGTNHTDLYQALCKSSSAPLSITVNKTLAAQSVTSTMTVTRGSNAAYTATASATITIPPLVTGYANVSGSIKKCVVWVNVNGTWKNPKAGYVNVNGTWKPMKLT